MANSSANTEAALAALKGRTLVLVGMMGAGKTSVGKRVAQRLGLKFAPKLKFRKDESFAEADRIEALLRDPKVARDLGEDDEE
jgi:ribosome-binding factor A